MGLLRDFDASALSRMRDEFESAKPFPHLVIDGFLKDDAAERLSDFPEPDWPHWNRHAKGFQKAKHWCTDITKIPANCADVLRECNDPPFLKALETITGIDQIIADPYLEGGGIQASSEGGVLIPHTDFHYYERLHLFRMINMIVYLNHDWKEEDGGSLELYDSNEKTPVVSVVPKFGRAVIFKTDDKSIHGFSKPVAASKWRKSLAIYYYKSQEAKDFSGDTTTYWRSNGTKLSGLRLAAFQGLTFTSRVFSRIAHRIDPNV